MTTTPHRIDVHHHLIPDVYARALRDLGITEVAGRELPAWSAAESLATMDRHGIDVAVTSISAPGVHFGDSNAARELARRCNEVSAETVADHPRRFGMFATLPMPDLDASINEAVYALDTLGADGIVMMSSHYDGSYLGDPRFDTLLAELDQRNAIVFVHPAIPTITRQIPLEIPVFAMEFTFDTTRAAFNLAFTGALERYPNIRWILSHGGGTVPYLVARFDLVWFQDPALVERAPKGGSAYLSKLFYDTALSANAHALRSLAELVGTEHVLFGSDFPFAPDIATGMQVAGLAAYEGYTESERHLVERTNALTLLPKLASRLQQH
jgi:6-methylsalicylate decarboxylase